MKHLEAIIEIMAPPEQVWRVLMDFERYPEWNPFIIRLEGIAGVGETLREVVRLPDGKQVRFNCRVVDLVPNHRLVWEGFAGAPFLFLGKHEFLLEESAQGTRFIQRETMTGLLLPFLKVEANLPGYHQMNQALKARVEAG